MRSHLRNISLHNALLTSLRLSTDPIIYGRGYLNFIDPKSLLDLSKSLTGMVVKDPGGYEGRLQVSLALYQAIPLTPVTPDPLEGTYMESECYKQFIATLEAEKPALLPLDKQAEVMLEKEKELHRKNCSLHHLINVLAWKYNKDLVKQTPLLVHLRSQKEYSKTITPLVKQDIAPRKEIVGKKSNKKSKNQRQKQKQEKPVRQDKQELKEKQDHSNAPASKPVIKIMTRPKDQEQATPPPAKRGASPRLSCPSPLPSEIAQPDPCPRTGSHRP